MKTAKLIKTNGEEIEVSPANGNDFTLDECYAHIGCNMVEVVELSDGRVMILDEEGKLKDEIERNDKATELFMQGRPTHAEYVERMKKEYGNNFIDAGMGDDELGNTIVGTVIVCSPDMFL
jgi:hypothetical protein